MDLLGPQFSLSYCRWPTIYNPFRRSCNHRVRPMGGALLTFHARSFKNKKILFGFNVLARMAGAFDMRMCPGSGAGAPMVRLGSPIRYRVSHYPGDAETFEVLESHIRA